MLSAPKVHNNQLARELYDFKKKKEMLQTGKTISNFNGQC